MVKLISLIITAVCVNIVGAYRSNLPPQIIGNHELTLAIDFPLSFSQLIARVIILIDDFDSLTADNVYIDESTTCDILSPKIGTCLLAIYAMDLQGARSSIFAIAMTYVLPSKPMMDAPKAIWIPTNLVLSIDVVDLFIDYQTDSLIMNIEQYPDDDQAMIVSVANELDEAYFAKIDVFYVPAFENSILVSFDDYLLIVTDEGKSYSYSELLSLLNYADSQTRFIATSVPIINQPLSGIKSSYYLSATNNPSQIVIDAQNKSNIASFYKKNFFAETWSSISNSFTIFTDFVYNQWIKLTNMFS